MNILWLWVFVLLVVATIARVIVRPERIYEYPYFMTAVFGIFILPQAFSLERFPGPAPESAVHDVLFMSCLCLGACLIQGRCTALECCLRQASKPVDGQKLFHAGVVFVGCGLVFNHLLANTDIQTSERGGWTGTATIYGFFQQLCYPGLAICLMAFLRQPSLFSFLAAAAAAIVPILSIVFGRREPAAMFVLTVGLSLFFQRRLRPSRLLVVAVLIFAMLAIPATTAYRRFQLQGDWNSIRRINLVESFRDFVDQESVLELRNAAMLIEATKRSHGYEWGRGYWNHLVFRYVPAQVFGQSLKDSLMFRGSDEAVERELAALDYSNPVGSTVTGIGDSFQQFGYFGCLVFTGIGMLFRVLWQAAANEKDRFAQLLYILTCTSAMRAVTHWTLDFLPGLLYGAVFLSGAVRYASVQESAGAPAPLHSRDWSLTPRRPGALARNKSARATHFPSALATMKIKTAPPNPPPSKR